ncbi:MAG: hypothetical protein AAGU21_14035 [Solidesulfovibrio sp.]|uniref:hypothetical protein n=1 Tax=Solidesulfovibrio sp. TaxID=2910990 RepID=UPI002B202EE3|nr:hypothetical protein [Solidesulfovibrio sp.]MEA4856075.1 hypothetical protein [Solidesulfovibrio sp.]
MPSLFKRLLLLTALLGALCRPGPAFARDAFETPAAPPAASLLPPAMLSGPNFVVDPVVATDGYLYVYTLRSRFGDLRVASTALLAKRIAETAALAKMEQVSSLQEFGGGMVAKGEQTLQGAADLVTNPIGTIQGAVTGVGQMFTNLGQDLSSGNVGNGSGAAKLLGLPALERQYAAQFGVDPYTTNPLVRKRLHDLASAGAAGNITATALASLIPGGAGIAVSAVGATATLNGVDLTASPEALARQNLAQLAAMGVPSETAAFFIGDQTFTPTQQTRIVASLAAMPAVGNKGAFVGFLAGTGDPDVARFRERMAAMYAGYNANVAPLTGFVTIGSHVAALNAAGKLVLVFPADCFFWTETNAVIARAFQDFARGFPASGIEIWAAGKASPRFARNLRAMGWSFHDQSAPRLLGAPY